MDHDIEVRKKYPRGRPKKGELRIKTVRKKKSKDSRRYEGDLYIDKLRLTNPESPIAIAFIENYLQKGTNATAALRKTFEESEDPKLIEASQKHGLLRLQACRMKNHPEIKKIIEKELEKCRQNYIITRENLISHCVQIIELDLVDYCFDKNGQFSEKLLAEMRGLGNLIEEITIKKTKWGSEIKIKKPSVMDAIKQLGILTGHEKPPTINTHVTFDNQLQEALKQDPFDIAGMIEGEVLEDSGENGNPGN